MAIQFMEPPVRITVNTERELKAAIARTMRHHEEKYGRPMTEKERNENLKLWEREFRPHLDREAKRRTKRAARLAKEKHDG